MGSRVSLPTSLTSFSVISANAKAAERWRSTFSENDKVVSAARGEPAKKLVVDRSGQRDASVKGNGRLKGGRSTDSLNTGGGLRRPRALSRGGAAHRRSSSSGCNSC